MGYDIHLYVERKREICNVEKWVNIGRWKINPFHLDDEEQEMTLVALCDARNYELFAMLANVRNRSGNPFIAEPRGLPDDCGEIVSKASKYWGCDGHSHSFFTLRELKIFSEGHKTVKHSGLMTAEGAKLVDSGKMPHSWWQGGNQTDDVYREWSEERDVMKPLIEKIEERKKENFWIYDDKEHPELDEQIRIVFWFDN